MAEHAAPPSLTTRAAHGMTWMVLQTLLSKPLNLLGQFVLAKIVLPQQFGLIALAFTPAVIADLIQLAGLREMLVRRPRTLRAWSSPAFWLALATGALAMGLLLACAPLAAWYYNAPPLANLIAVLALAIPFNALAVVPDAAISVQLRFRPLAIINLVTSLFQMALTVGLALALPDHLDAFAFAWPYPATAVLRTALLWWAAPMRITRRARLRHWPMLLRDSALLLAGSIGFWIANLAGIMVLGRTHGEDAVGAMYFATLISSQTVAVLELNLLNVLMPSLAHLNDDPARQRGAFLRAAGAITLVGAPASLFIAVTADPLLRALFGEKWTASIPILQVIAIAMALRPTTLAGIALMKANGRFVAFALLFAFWALLHLALAWMGARAFENGALGVACATAAYFALLGPVTMFIAIRPLGGSAGDVLRTHAVPVVAGAVGAAMAYGAMMLVPGELAIANWLCLGIAFIVMPVVCLVILLRLGGRPCVELFTLLARSAAPVPPVARLFERLRTEAARHAAAPGDH